jgi:hypothetical protein
MNITLRFLLTTSFVLTGSAFADTFQFDSPGLVEWDGVFVNPYTAHQTAPTVGPALTIYCDDWNTDFSGNPAWNANVYAITASNLSNLKYGSDTTETFNLTPPDVSTGMIGYTKSLNDPDPLDRYLEAAYLDSLWQAQLQTASPSTTVQEELAAAVWSLFVDSGHVDGLITAINAAGNPSGFATAVYDDVLDAQSAVKSGFTGQRWEVITPVDGTSMQEFLVYTPEPGALLLLGTVIAGLGVTVFRKRRC